MNKWCIIDTGPLTLCIPVHKSPCGVMTKSRSGDTEGYSVTDLMIHTVNALCKYAPLAPPSLYVSVQITTASNYRAEEVLFCYFRGEDTVSLDISTLSQVIQGISVSLSSYKQK